MTPLRLEERGNGAVAPWLNRPEARNALDAELVGELEAARPLA
jgi:enoyl-CoA hydratase/carnithine racemase